MSTRIDIKSIIFCFMHSDVRAEEDDIINAVDFVVKRFGKLDILINYAEHHVPISRTVLTDLKLIFGVNI